MALEVGDKGIVFGMGSGQEQFVPVGDVEVGDDVAVYNLKNDTKIAVPILSFDIGDPAFVSPSFQFSGFNWNLDFNFNLIPLDPLFITDVFYPYGDGWSWDGWSYSLNRSHAKLTEVYDTGATDDRSEFSPPEGATTFGWLGWHTSYISFSGLVATMEKTFSNIGYHRCGMLIYVGMSAVAGGGTRRIRVYVDGVVEYEKTLEGGAAFGWARVNIPFGEYRSNVTVKLERYQETSRNGFFLMDVGRIGFYNL